jgi:excisionase family DNA binding protein
VPAETGVILDEDALRALIKDCLREVLAESRAPVAEGYLSVNQAAELAAVTAGTIRDWVRAGRLPRFVAGRHLRVKRADLEALLAGGGRRDLPDPEQAALADFHRERRRVGSGRG